MQADVSVLDSLVEEYLIQEELTDKSPAGPAVSSLPARHACEVVRILLDQGDIQGATDAIPEQCQQVLQDQRLLFQLKKQEIVEYLRQGTAEGQQKALDCIRHGYASLAEHAYPEAYSEFKHTMLLLVFQEEVQNSPVKQDWSLDTRSRLAGMLCRTLKQHAGIYPSQLALLLRHLLLSYKAGFYCVHSQASISQPAEVVALPDKLISPRKPKDAAPLPCEEHGGSAGSVAGADAQALVTALSVSWEEASHLLKHTQGDLTAAFKNELSAYHLDEQLLDDLVWEYAACRGLLSLPEADSSESSMVPGSQRDCLHPPQQTPSSPQAAKNAQLVSQLGSGVPEDGAAASNGKGMYSGSSSRRSAKADRMPQTGCRQHHPFGVGPDSAAPRPSAASEKGSMPQTPHSIDRHQPSNSPSVSDSLNRRAESTSDQSAQHPGAASGRSQTWQSGIAGFSRQPDAAWLDKPSPADGLHRQPNAGSPTRQSNDGSGTTSSSRKRDAPGPSLVLDQQELQGTGISGRSSYLHSPPRKVPCWKGRARYPFPAAPSSHPNPSQAPTGPGPAGQDPNFRGHCPISTGLLPQRYQLLHRLVAALEAGEVQQVMQQLEEVLGADAMPQHPELLFELHRSQFHSLLEAGQTEDALQLLRAQMTPLCQQHAHLQPKLQAAMGCLLPGAPSSATRPSPQGFSEGDAGGLQEALRSALGLPQPRLLGLTQMLLSAHEAWYQMQRYKDRFEGLLSIDRLKKGTPKDPATPSGPAHLQPHPEQPSGDVRMADAAGNISSDHDEEHQSDDLMSESDELVLSEDVIIMTMEVTSLPRHQVIDLLLHNDGDPQAVLAQLFP